MFERHWAIALAFLTCILWPGTTLLAGNDSVAGVPAIEEPTIHNLGIEWFITGDDNSNAAVAVQYRRQRDPGKEEPWLSAMPLWRVNNTGPIDKVPLGQALFAGSILNLKEGTTYEIQLTLTDPDGGDMVQVLTAATKSEPTIPRKMNIRYVIPGLGGGSGTAADPFRGLQEADAAAQPGDIMRLARGTYFGPVDFSASGTADRPIIWMGPANRAAYIEGDGNLYTVNATNLSNVWFERLTIQNAITAVEIDGSSDLVFRYNNIREALIGIHGDNPHVYAVFDPDTWVVEPGEEIEEDAVQFGLHPVWLEASSPMKGIYIADNTITGPVQWGMRYIDATDLRISWLDPLRMHFADTVGVDVSGDGIIIAHNRLYNWGDAIHGVSPDSGHQPRNDHDIYNNEISECYEDAIELDAGAQNMRVYNNRITNSRQGISAQPVYGGPAYIFRNALYNITSEPFKLDESPDGVLIINNTSVRSVNSEPAPMYLATNAAVFNARVFNNLFTGGAGAFALQLSPTMVGSQFDYNAYACGPFGNFAEWNGTVYPTIESFRAVTGQETHGRVVCAQNVFRSRVFPILDCEKCYLPRQNSLLVAPSVPTVDGGIVFPGISDRFTGAAPDMGVYETGMAVPRYGPRG